MLDIRDNLRDDERRRRDEARLNDLQEQIDELRLLLQESISRQGKGEEARQALAEAVAGITGQIEAARAEARALNEARIVELTRVRADMEGLDQRLSAAVVPIPSLQSQITDVANQTRAKFQELGEDRHRFGELQAQIDRLPPLVDRSAEIARGARDEVGGLRRELDALRADLHKTSDAVGIAEQGMRRQVGDVAARVDETNRRIDALKDELPPLDMQIDRVRHELHQHLPKFDALEKVDRELREETDRVAALDFERHVQALARADEIRGVVEERVRAVERLNDTRFGSTMARFSELEEADKSLGHRLTLLAVRLDELRDQDQAIRQEMRRLEEMRIKVRLEQAQAEAMAFSERLRQFQESLVGGDEDDED